MKGQSDREAGEIRTHLTEWCTVKWPKIKGLTVNHTREQPAVVGERSTGMTPLETREKSLRERFVWMQLVLPLVMPIFTEPFFFSPIFCSTGIFY